MPLKARRSLNYGTLCSLHVMHHCEICSFSHNVVIDGQSVIDVQRRGNSQSQTQRCVARSNRERCQSGPFLNGVGQFQLIFQVGGNPPQQPLE